MRMLQMLLTSVLSLLLAGPGFARDAAVRAPSDLLILAQHDGKCPPGSKCAAERRKENREKRAGERRENRRGKAQDAKEQGGGKPRAQKPGNQQGKKRQEQGQQDKQPSAKAKRNGGQKAAEPRNQGRNAEKPRREERPTAAPANKEKPRAEPEKRKSEQREIRRERREQRRDQAVDKPTPGNGAKRRPDRDPAVENRERGNGAEKPRERDQGRKPKPDSAQEPARDRDAKPAEAPGSARERPRADQAPAAATREERRRERAERRARRRENANQRPARQQDRDATTVERQLAAQGRGDEADRVRELRRKLRRQREAAQERRAERRENAEERRDAAERRERRRDREVVERRGDRLIVRFGANLFIEPQEADDRLLWRARDVEVEEFGDGFTRTIVYRENGVRVVTVRDPYGNIVSRTRYVPEGPEIVLIGQPYVDYPPEPIFYEEIVLPPLVVPLPQPEYIVETRVATPVQIETALTAPPVEAVERAYTLEEVRRSERLRDKMRRVDIDTITFELGSAVIPEDQLDSLDRVGEAIEETLRTDPDEVFLIEGHTDAVGSEQDNLVLSDRRAEAVAVALSEEFDIPPENLVTQGYGEDQLKLETEAAERQNRRVAVRRITPLLEGVAQKQ